MEQIQSGTFSIEQAARRLGIGRGAAYMAAREGRLPVPVIRIGRRVLVSRAAVEALLAATAPTDGQVR